MDANDPSVKGNVCMYLMCPPDYFKVDYSINPWMKGEQVNLEIAKKQWNHLKVFLSSLGATIKTITPHPDYPDMVFTANAGVVHDNRVVLSNFKHTERMGEKEYFKKWFLDNDYDVYELPEDIIFEGRGDCFVYKGHLIGGYGQRSQKEAIVETAKILELVPVAVELLDPRYYHLDTCLSILDSHKGLAIYTPGAFNKDFEKLMASIDLNLIPVTAKESQNFACNAISFNGAVLFPRGSDKLERELERHGYVPADIAMSEFMKSGGACRCLVLEI